VPGDEKSPALGPGWTFDKTGAKIIRWIEFGKTEVTFTIRRDASPEHPDPYQIVIHAPFGQDITSTTDGTNYVILWKAVSASGNQGPPQNAGPRPPGPGGGNTPAQTTNSVALSPRELMMIPHDTHLKFDIYHDPETDFGDWIRLQATGPTGDVLQTVRIQTFTDPVGKMGSEEVAEAEINAISAPYLPNSLEKRCDVQRMKGASGEIYYCILSNDAFVKSLTRPAEEFRYLFLGVFRISGNAALVIGNLSHKDDVNFRMMQAMLAGIYTLPIVNDATPPRVPPKSVNPQ
jgi:hypothetical protein